MTLVSPETMLCSDDIYSWRKVDCIYYEKQELRVDPWGTPCYKLFDDGIYSQKCTIFIRSFSLIKPVV
jgi:hypothetical protein